MKTRTLLTALSAIAVIDLSGFLEVTEIGLPHLSPRISGSHPAEEICLACNGVETVGMQLKNGFATYEETKADGYFLDHDANENRWYLYFMGYVQGSKPGGPHSPEGIYDSAPNIQASYEVIARPTLFSSRL